MNASIGGNITSKGEGNNGLALYCRSFSVLFFLLLIISIYQRDKYQYITTSQSKEIINYHIIKLEREPGARMPKGQSQRSQNAKRARAKEARMPKEPELKKPVLEPIQIIILIWTILVLIYLDSYIHAQIQVIYHYMTYYLQGCVNTYLYDTYSCAHYWSYDVTYLLLVCMSKFTNRLTKL